jgi:leucyl aminopeptidase
MTRAAATEGAIVGSYRMEDLRTDVSRTGREVRSVGPLFASAADRDRLAPVFARAALASEAQNLARWLAERPANLMTPRLFTQQARTVHRWAHVLNALTPSVGERVGLCVWLYLCSACVCARA